MKSDEFAQGVVTILREVGQNGLADFIEQQDLELRQLRERLKGIEWHVSRGVTQMEYQCNVCGGHKHYGGHKADCWLAKEISKLGAE